MTEPPEPEAAAPTPQPEIDPVQLQFAMERFRSEQNLSMGIVAGTAAALLSAAVWALITVTTGYQFGIAAIGVGFVVGMAVQFAGKGVDPVFGFVGGVLALFGCLLGNLLAACGLAAKQLGIGFSEVFDQLDLVLIRELMVGTFRPMDLLFYGIAVYQGYKIGIREVTASDLQGGRFSPGGS